MNFVHRFLSAWFGFNKQQRNGLLVLCALVFLLFVVRLSISSFIKPEPILLADFSNVNLPESNSNVLVTDSSSDNNTLFVFNPNTVSKEQLVKLGFKEKTANTFINYRNKGAHFNKKEDVKKVYGVTEELYSTIEAYILIEGEKITHKTFSKQEPSSKKQIKVVELNTVDSIGLLPLPGIGPAYAKRILKYRSLLGGFYSTEQLKEVYGFTDSLFQIVKAYVKVDASLVTKIDLNTEDFKKLNAHPYISYEDTKSIFNYRRKNGPITKLEHLRVCIYDEEQLKKIIPYLSF
ncbi:MAG: helix-hairpin-helix domain-containing protein [Sphingobacteriaceae bacterium]|nr:helix-hairpin-helix domain-containing protein [Sphingobacteriaceae bacterium]